MFKLSRKQEKGFKYYSALPAELRMMIVDEMMALDRGKFSRCSKRCNSEANASRNHVVGLMINNFRKNIIEVDIVHGEDNDVYYGFSYVIKERRGRKYVKCSKLWSKNLLWVKKLSRATNLFDISCHFFKYLLKLHQRTIRTLWIFSRFFENNFNFEVKLLNNLEKLGVDSRFLPQFLSKLRKPLKILEIYGEVEVDDMDYDKILQVQKRVSASSLKLDCEQLQRLCAEKASIHIGQLTEQDVVRFIRSWQNMTSHEQLKRFTWNLAGSSFSVHLLIRYLGAQEDDDGWYHINHLKDSVKCLYLFASDTELVCEWRYNVDWSMEE